jgi:lactoylglutathione lyase
VPLERFRMKFTYTGVEVRDMDRSIEFYHDVIGMEFLGRKKIEATGGEVAALKTPGLEHVLELNWYPNSKYQGGSELDHLAFECEDVRMEVDRLSRAGASIARPIEVRPRYIVGFVTDPNGIWLELYQERK